LIHREAGQPKIRKNASNSKRESKTQAAEAANVNKKSTGAIESNESPARAPQLAEVEPKGALIDLQNNKISGISQALKKLDSKASLKKHGKSPRKRANLGQDKDESNTQNKSVLIQDSKLRGPAAAQRKVSAGKRQASGTKRSLSSTRGGPSGDLKATG